MVDGVHGDKVHAARLVVVELYNLPEHVAIPHHHVEDYLVEELVSLRRHAMNFVVTVRIKLYTGTFNSIPSCIYLKYVIHITVLQYAAVQGYIAIMYVSAYVAFYILV